MTHTSQHAPAAVAVIEAPASFGFRTAAAVRDQAIRAQRDGAAVLVIDLAATEFMDNVALGVIVGAQHRLRQAGGWLAVAAASDAVTALFRRTGLTRHIPMYPAPHDAVTAATAAAAGEAHIHIVSRPQDWLDRLGIKIPRALCGELLTGTPGGTEPGPGSPVCPACESQAR
jgi:anti-sigma B factor antagonist